MNQSKEDQSNAQVKAEKINFEKEKIESQINEWAAKLAELKVKAEEASSGVKATYLEQINSLESNINALRQKYNDIKGTTGQVADELKDGLLKAAENIKEAFIKAKNIIK
ncbi:MAG: hypothetical protein ABIH50_06055 [bacterium]